MPTNISINESDCFIQYSGAIQRRVRDISQSGSVIFDFILLPYGFYQFYIIKNEAESFMKISVLVYNDSGEKKIKLAEDFYFDPPKYNYTVTGIEMYNDNGTTRNYDIKYSIMKLI